MPPGDGDVVEEDVRSGMAAEVVVVSASRTKVLPAFGPRRTTSMPEPVGQLFEDVTALLRSSSTSGCSIEVQRADAPVVSSSRRRGSPQDEQKLAPPSLSCPQRRQRMLRGYP